MRGPQIDTLYDALGFCDLLPACPIGTREFVMSKDSNILFELEWMPNYVEFVLAFTELYGKAPRRPMTD
jgi:hypothetical protein